MDSTVSQRVTITRSAIWLTLVVSSLTAQVDAPTSAPSWRRAAFSAVDLQLADVATGSIDRIGFEADGVLFARTPDGRRWRTSDFETWRPADTDAAFIPPVLPATGALLPEPGARLVGARGKASRVYAIGRSVWRSDDGGVNWVNVTRNKQGSILGEGLADLAVNPSDADDIVTAGATGIWRSLDGGMTWNGLNGALPNLPIRRLFNVPGAGRGFAAAIDGIDGVLEWAPGERSAWRRNTAGNADDPAIREQLLKQILSQQLREKITAVTITGDWVYAGTEAGRIAVSRDLLRTWRWSNTAFAGGLETISTDTADGAVALAITRAPNGARLWRTIDGGNLWDDITADLPAGAVFGAAFDKATGAVYAATANGLFLTYGDFKARGPETPWTRVAGDLPAAAVRDVRLNAAGTLLYVAVDGWGVYATTAPHRRRDPRLVSSADFSPRAAAPGSLLSVVGANVKAARVNNANAPVLAAATDESQIQIPFNATGAQLNIALDGFSARLPLEATAPAIFLDRDGTPMLIDAETGLLLDARQPLRPGARIQVMAAGLGRVRPEWTAGVPAPLENPPEVVAAVRVVLDRISIQPIRATLAPGYVGFYLVEFQVPALVNAGPAELSLEAAGRESNRSRIFLQP